jgi:hypothetical protein
MSFYSPIISPLHSCAIQNIPLANDRIVLYIDKYGGDKLEEATKPGAKFEATCTSTVVPTMGSSVWRIAHRKTSRNGIIRLTNSSIDTSSWITSGTEILCFTPISSWLTTYLHNRDHRPLYVSLLSPLAQHTSLHHRKLIFPAVFQFFCAS